MEKKKNVANCKEEKQVKEKRERERVKMKA